MNKQISLGINIDHIASIRNFRNTIYPDLIKAVFIAEKSGADSITTHLREDRRHINENDLSNLRKVIKTKMNLEIALTDEMVNIACRIKPDICCFVPENRKEITTENGLDVIKNKKKIKFYIKKLKDNGINVSLFINPDNKQVYESLKLGASCIEIHTGYYSLASSSYQKELFLINNTAKYAKKLGLQVNAGHGLNYTNVIPIASIKEIKELNIGHSIISKALFKGLSNAIKIMKSIIKR